MREARWVPAGRAIVLVDLENLTGEALPSEEESEAAIRTLRRGARLTRDDHVIVGCHPGLALTAHRVAGNARLVCRRGPDGADLALLDCCDPADLARRFARAVIASGDHIFAELALSLRERGVHVTVVSLQRCLARGLARVADVVICVGDDQSDTEAVEVISMSSSRPSADRHRRHAGSSTHSGAAFAGDRVGRAS